MTHNETLNVIIGVLCITVPMIAAARQELKIMVKQLIKKIQHGNVH